MLIAEKKIKEQQKAKKNEIKKSSYISNKKEYDEKLKNKGDEYEKFVSDYFKTQGYTIAEHGLDNGKKDHGIDLIAKREKEVIFVQCKNWKISEDYQIDHRHIKEFIGNCTTYIEKNPMFAMCTIKRYYAVSDEIMDKSAERFISQNPQSIQKLLLQLP